MIDDADKFRGLKVWLVHDWLTGMRGGEKVLLELVRLFPDSRIATLVHVPGTTDGEIDQRVKQTSFLQRMPGAKKGYRNYLPLFPRAIRSLQLDGPCDLVLSSSHAVAKNVRVPAGVRHLCYCHTPMRYIWGLEGQYIKPRSAKGIALATVRGYLRRADLQGTAGVTRFVANSATVADRIKRIYARDAAVVHPGMDETFWKPGGDHPHAPGTDYFLVVSALVGYKRVDLAIEAARITGQRLVVVGKGPEEVRLRKLASGLRNVEFLGWRSDDDIRSLYQGCVALVFAGEEDFGLTPVEAMACGRPVVAYYKGGVTETVTPETGVFFGKQTPAALAQAMQTAQRREWHPQAMRRRALDFTWDRFKEGILREVGALLKGDTAILP
jgi:glycosyltransferase involved in cell wall biosynthesis